MPALVMLARELTKDSQLEVFSGALPGFETAVRMAAQMIGIEVGPLEPSVDWHERAELVKNTGVEHVLFFHADPHASRMLPALLEVFGDAVEIVTPELMMV